MVNPLQDVFLTELMCLIKTEVQFTYAQEYINIYIQIIPVHL